MKVKINAKIMLSISMAISAATLSYYFAPVIVTAVCPILFKEKLSGKQMICFSDKFRGNDDNMAGNNVFRICVCNSKPY